MFLKALVITALALQLAHNANAKEQESVNRVCPEIASGVVYYRGAAWKWQDKLALSKTRSDFKPERVFSCDYAMWVAHLWKHRAAALRTNYIKVREQGALTSDWACIHHYEGAWNSNTGNGYYGGLQMDSGFMQTYGPEFVARWGTADNWPVYAQIATANRAKQSGRGYSPWPSTARACGLL